MIMAAADLLSRNPNRPRKRSGTASRATSAAARATTTSSRRSSTQPVSRCRHERRRAGPARNGFVGQAIRRKEDPRLITGRATYVDDSSPGMLHAAIVRSPEAHARVVSIDASAALERDDVRAVYTGEDMTDLLTPCP